MSRIACQGRAVDLSYSTNVHPAESVEQLIEVLAKHVAPVSRGAFGDETAAVNLRLGRKQADELCAHGTLPSTSTLSDGILSAPPGDACQKLIDALKANKLRVASVNGFPVLDFHAPRVKEMVYSPPWTDGGRVLTTLMIAKVLANLLGDAKESSVSVPTGTFKGYNDGDEIKAQCAHFITELVRELARLERLTGKTIRIGLEPEPHTTGETIGEFIDYFKRFILVLADEKFPSQLGICAKEAEALARKFVTINLDLCHQAVEYEDAVEDLKRLRAEGIAVSGVHVSAALKLAEPAQNADGWSQLKAMDEPRYLHQVVAKLRDGTFARFEDLPDLWNPRRLKGKKLEDFAELRCHFHVPLFAEWPGALKSTRDGVPAAVRFAAKEGITDNFVVETYTWNVLAELAKQGSAGARTIVGGGAVDVNAGLVKEILWAKEALLG